VREPGVDGEPFARERDRRTDELVEGEAPRSARAPELVEPARRARDADRDRSRQRARGDARPVLREEAVRARRGGSRLAEVEGARGADVRDEEREAAAPEVPGLREDDGQRESRGDGRVDRVAAAVEDLEPDLRRQRVLGDDGALLRRAPERLLLELRAAAAGGRDEAGQKEEREAGASGLPRR